MTEQEELELLKQKSPYALPDNPSQSGWSTDQIKRKHYEGLFFLYDLFKQQRTNIAADVEAMQAIVDLINEEYQDIISGNPIKAKYDDENNEIKITYAKVLSLVDGTLGVLKYLKRNNSTGYIYTLEEDLEIVKSDLTKIFNGTKVVDRSYSDQNGNNISNTYVKKTDIVNDFTSHAIDKPLSANKGRELKSLIDTLFDYVGYADATDENTVIDKLREVFAFLTNVDDSQTLLDVVDGKIALVANGTNINTFADVEAALALKANSSNVYDKTETYTKTEIDNKDTSNLQQAKSYTDSKIEDLKWELGTYDLSVDMDTTTAYTKAVPSGAIGCKINTIGGMSYKINQLMGNGDFVNTTGWSGARGTISVSNNTCKYTISELTGSDIESHRIQKTTSYVSGHTYFMSYFIKSPKNCHATITCPNGGIGYNVQGTSVSANTKTLVTRIATANSSGTNLFYFCFDGYNSQNGFVVGDKIEYTACQTFDLTAMGIDTTDVSTAISELAKRGIDINTYQEYNTGSIRDSAVTSVVSEDSNNTTIDTLTIADEIQALEGYGWGVSDSVNNSVNLETKKYVKNVTKLVLNGSEEGWAYNATYQVATLNNISVSSYINADNYLIDNDKYVKRSSNGWTQTFSNIAIIYTSNGIRIDIKDISFDNLDNFKNYLSNNNLTIYYKLETPIETDISQYISDSTIQIEAGGSLTANNTYNQAVPTSIDYLIEEVKA